MDTNRSLFIIILLCVLVVLLVTINNQEATALPYHVTCTNSDNRIIFDGIATGGSLADGSNNVFYITNMKTVSAECTFVQMEAK